MKIFALSGLCVLILTGLVTGAAQRETTTSRTLRFAGDGGRSLDIRAIKGSIHVTGYDGNEVQLEARRTTDADSEADRRSADQDVRLDVSEGAPRIAIAVHELTWPLCGDSGPWNSDGKRRRYDVRFDFTVRVPHNTELYLCTINGGDIRVDGTTGDFDVSNINGRITMTGIRGSGRATTVNGPVNVTFLESPRTASMFKTINGDVDLTFSASLAADFSMKTMHGDLLTDFDVERLAGPVAAAERRDGRYIYRSGGFTRVRVGGGGPVITLETLNGDVRLRRTTR
jgi:hypothetical protein